MGLVQEKPVRSCFGRCKVNFQTPAYTPLPSPLPSTERFRMPSASFEEARLSPPRPRLGSEHCRVPPSLAPSLHRAEPSATKPEPPRLLQPRLGAVHHSQRLKPHPAPVAGASTGLQACHCRLHSSEVLKRPL